MPCWWPWRHRSPCSAWPWPAGPPARNGSWRHRCWIVDPAADEAQPRRGALCPAAGGSVQVSGRSLRCAPAHSPRLAAEIGEELVHVTAGGTFSAAPAAAALDGEAALHPARSLRVSHDAEETTPASSQRPQLMRRPPWTRLSVPAPRDLHSTASRRHAWKGRRKLRSSHAWTHGRGRSPKPLRRARRLPAPPRLLPWMAAQAPWSPHRHRTAIAAGRHLTVPPRGDPGSGGEWHLLVAKVQDWFASGAAAGAVGAACAPP